jgi:hypothetical protein
MVQKKLRMNFGGNVGLTSFDQRDVHKDITRKRDFVNWYPQAMVAYMFNTQRRLSLNYNGNTRQPGIDQIQPLRTNEDPLNVTIGNPDLKPQFSNSVRIQFYDYKMLSERSFWMGLNYNFTNNAISSRSVIDGSGRRTNQAVNVDGNRSASLYMDYGIKLKKSDTRVGGSTELFYNRYVNYVNDALNVTNSGNYRGGLYINHTKEKKYEIRFNANATYTNSSSSIQQHMKINYWVFTANPNVTLYMPLKFELHTDCSINIRQRTAVFNTNNNVFLWNAWIGKKFMKSDALLVKLSVNDLLQENIGFNRQVNSNFITQNTYSTISRYLFLSVTWNFNKTGGGAAKQ